MEHLWEEGAPKSSANYVVAAIQFYRPESKHHLAWLWKLVKVWNQLEVPQRATPMTPELLMAFAGQAFCWQQFELGWLLVITFTLFLQTGELLQIKAQDMVFGGTSGVLYLFPSKGGKRLFLPLERVKMAEQITVQAFRVLLRHKQPGDPLWSATRQQFMSLWHSLVDALKLQNCNFFPYSLRRGGASSAYSWIQFGSACYQGTLATCVHGPGLSRYGASGTAGFDSPSCCPPQDPKSHNSLSHCEPVRDAWKGGSLGRGTITLSVMFGSYVSHAYPRPGPQVGAPLH